MVPFRTSIEVVPLDNDADLFFPSIDEDQGIYDFARFINRVIFPDRQDEIALSRMDGKVGIAVNATGWKILSISQLPGTGF
jgi:hypothetical protein